MVVETFFVLALAHHGEPNAALQKVELNDLIFISKDFDAHVSTDDVTRKMRSVTMVILVLMQT